MIVIGQETRAAAEAFTRRFPDTARRAEIPDGIDQVPARARASRLLYFASQYEHMDLVTGGRVIPLLLQLTPLPGLQKQLTSKLG